MAVSVIEAVNSICINIFTMLMEAGSFTGPAFLIANVSVSSLLSEPEGGRKR